MLFVARHPAEAEVVMGVHSPVAVEKQVLPPDLQPAVPAGEAGQDAEPFVAVGVVDLDLNIRRPCWLNTTRALVDRQLGTPS